MSSWAIVAIVAILVWGVVQFVKASKGIITDEDGNETFVGQGDARTQATLEATQRELAELKERVKVLERIATDAHSGDAREQARIAAEIEALRSLPARSEEGDKA